jgi:membrane-bound lytic murein transglycosylase A
MFPKTTRQVNLLINIALLLLPITIFQSQAMAGTCTDSWRPDSPRTSCDDLFYKDLATSLEQNITTLGRTAPESIKICQQNYSRTAIIEAYSALRDYIAHHTPIETSRYIDRHFNLCAKAPVLITGYYEPQVKASLQKTAAFPVPLYTAPPTDRPVIFNSPRKLIETTDILSEYELVYVRDLFTAFTIHIQGSALLTFADGSMRKLRYKSSNGLPYTSVGRILIDRGLVTREDMSMQAIKLYTENHPEQTAELLHTNARFIYFSLSKPTHSPASPPGSFNVPLTPERSIALDPSLYPQGLLFHLQGTLPVPVQEQNGTTPRFHRRAFSRFMLNQDSGSAIKGHRRVDIFMGRGTFAEIMAGEMQEQGCLRVLLPK